MDWGDSTNGPTNDFLSDLLPHYVTPRHRRINNGIDDDFHDVILGSSKFCFVRYTGPLSRIFKSQVCLGEKLVGLSLTYEFAISGFQENNKTRKKLFPKEAMTNLQNDSYKRTSIKNQTKKPSSLSSVPSKNHHREKSKSEFIIPELPEGRLLEIKIFSNWGDKYLVGLNGIELFDMHGNIVNIEKVSRYLTMSFTTQLLYQKYRFNSYTIV